MASCFKHRQLLHIHGLNDPVLLLHSVGERKNGKGIQLFFNRLEVPFYILKLEFDAFSDDFSRGIFVLGNLEIALSGHLSVGSGLLSLRVCRMGFIDDRFCDFPGLSQ
jgi:hypothetical protein